MHFVIGANVDDSNTTGMGRQMHGLGESLREKGHQIDYLFSDSLAARNRRRLSRLEAPFRAALALRRIANAVDRPPIAILHEPIAWTTALLPRRLVRTLTMVHACEIKGWSFQVATRNVTGEQIKPLSRVVWPVTELSQTYASLRLSDGVLCLSESDRSYIVNRVGVSPHRIARIDNGLENTFLGLTFAESERTKDLLFLGSWLPRKGVRFLTQALQMLSAAGLHPTLTLAGTGYAEAEIRPQLPEPWRSSAEILPHVPANQLVDVYRRHKILVLPSVAEGIPLVILEAMACGVCLVVTSVGGVPDVVDDGSTGWVVPPLDVPALAAALTKALQEPDETRQLAQNAYAKVQGYGWRRAADQVEQFCSSLFSSEPRTMS
jgi:glycosyltransferase involved in cell wall biosynthesis